jgi:hypothetical protein
LSGDKNTDKIDINQGSDDDEDLIEEFGREEFENQDDEDEDEDDEEENAEMMKT